MKTREGLFILVGLLFWLQAILQLKYVHEDKRKERLLMENINREEAVGEKIIEGQHTVRPWS